MDKLRISQRTLPHWELDNATYFVTFNTWEKLPLTPAAQQVVLDACLFFSDQRYKLWTAVVMPDHVHMLLRPLPKENSEKVWTLSSIMHSIKSYSAKQVPLVMNHIGTVWQPERYDRIIRNAKEFENTFHYIRQNPVKANLVNSYRQYPYLWECDRLAQS